MSRRQLRNLEPTREKMSMEDFYLRGLFWVLRERAGGGGWPPRDINKVAGWTVVRLLADLSGRSSRQVAADVIEHALHLGDA
jgi:hypothetical protein